MFLRYLILLSFLLVYNAVYAYDVPLSVAANAQTLEDAKSKALHDGQRKAFYTGLSTLAPSQARDIYRDFRNKDVTSFVSDYKITREVERAGYYEADVIYIVNEDDIKTLLKSRQGIFASDTNDAPPQGNGLLIIPAYDAGEQLLLWERENLWRQALNNSAVEKGKGLLVMPFGDPRDISVLDDTAILTDDSEALKSSATRYGTRNVVISTARLREQNGTPILEVLLRSAGSDKQSETKKQYVAQNDETAPMLIARAADETASLLAQSINKYSLYGQPDSEKLKPLVVRFEYRTGKQWRALQELFSRIANVKKVDIGLVGVTHAEVTFIYKGNANMIKSFFTRQEYNVDTSKDYWVVTAP